MHKKGSLKYITEIFLDWEQKKCRKQAIIPTYPYAAPTATTM